jgi:hypothetical protein
MCRWEEARGVPDQVVRLACQALHMVRLAPSPNNTKECVAPDMLRALPEQIDEPASLVATFFQACMGAQVEFNAPLALLPETLDDWTKDGVAKDPQAWSNLDPFVDEVAEKRSK